MSEKETTDLVIPPKHLGEDVFVRFREGNLMFNDGGAIDALWLNPEQVTNLLKYIQQIKDAV